MTAVGAYEAKTHLSELLERAAQGEEITITKHGHPVAKLVPIGRQGVPDPRTAVEQLRRFGDGHTLGDLGLRDLIEHGRRS